MSRQRLAVRTTVIVAVFAVLARLARNRFDFHSAQRFEA